MRKMIQVVFIVNILAGLSVWALSQFISIFSITGIGDLLFGVMVLIWGIAGIGMGGGTQSQTVHASYAGSKTKSMVADQNFDSVHGEKRTQNLNFGLVMFVAGIPAFVGCAYLMWVS